VATVGLAAAGLALWSVARRAAPVPSGPGSGPSSPPSATSSQSPKPPYDARRDRDMTAVPEAFAAYEEGLRLFDKLPIQAIQRFKKAVALDPAFAPAHYRLAMAAIVASRQDEARSAIRSAERNKERLPEPYSSALPVVGHFADGSFDLAMAAMGDALARQPGDPDLHYMAGTISARVCDYFDPNSLIEHYERVLAADPAYPGVREELLEGYEMKGMSEWLLSRAQSHEDRDGAVAEMGRARIARGEYGDAMEAADEILRRGADVFASGLAPAFILTGHHDQLASMYDPEQERTNSSEANVLTHLHAGINDVWMGRWAKAVEHFERGPEFLPAPWDRSRRARFMALLGRTQLLMGRMREAEAAFESAQTVAGPQPVLEYLLGTVLLKAGNTAGAERVVHRLSMESRPSLPGWNEPWRLLMAAEVALAAGDTPRAMEAFRSAWQLEEPLALDCVMEHPEAYFLDGLGRGYLAARRPQEALQSFERIRALGARGIHQPEILVLAHYRAGLALEALGRTDEAAARYQQFLQLWGGIKPAPAEVVDTRRRVGGAGAR